MHWLSGLESNSSLTDKKKRPVRAAQPCVITVAILPLIRNSWPRLCLINRTHTHTHVSMYIWTQHTCSLCQEVTKRSIRIRVVLLYWMLTVFHTSASVTAVSKATCRAELIKYFLNVSTWCFLFHITVTLKFVSSFTHVQTKHVWICVSLLQSDQKWSCKSG